MAKRFPIFQGTATGPNTYRYTGDVELGSIPSGRTIEVVDGTLTVNGVMGEDVKIRQQGKGGVIINARTHWNADIQADGSVAAVSTAYKTKIRAGKDVHIRYSAYNGSDIEAAGKVHIGDEAHENVRIKGQTVDIGGQVHDGVSIEETGKGRFGHHTLTINGLMGKHVSIRQQGNGDVDIKAATNHFAAIRSEGDITVSAAVYKTKLQAGKDIHVRYDVHNGAELNAKGKVAIKGKVTENASVRGSSVDVKKGIGPNVHIVQSGAAKRGFAARVQSEDTSLGASR